MSLELAERIQGEGNKLPVVKSTLPTSQAVFKSDDRLNKYISVGLALIALAVFIFYSRDYVFPEVTEGDTQIQFVDVTSLQPKSQVQKKELSTTEGEAADDNNQTGSFNSDNFVDLDFNPNIAKPSLIGRLKFKHPQLAKEQGIEAKAKLTVFIAKTGQIKKIRIKRIKFLKPVPEGIRPKLEAEFRKRILQALRKKRYQPALDKGVPIAVRSDQIIDLKIR